MLYMIFAFKQSKIYLSKIDKFKSVKQVFCLSKLYFFKLLSTFHLSNLMQFRLIFLAVYYLVRFVVLQCALFRTLFSVYSVCSVCCWFIASLWVGQSFWATPAAELSLWFVINMSQLARLWSYAGVRGWQEICRLIGSATGQGGGGADRLIGRLLLTLAGNGRWPRSASCKPEAASDSTTSACDGKWLLTNALLSICSVL